MKRTPYRAPIATALIRAFRITAEKAATIRGLIRGEISTQDAKRFPLSNAYFRRCYHFPKRLKRILYCH